MKIKLLLSLLLISFSQFVNAQQGFPFADEIKAYTQQDSISPPPKNAILFIGSSSIRKWTDLKVRFADKAIIQRGVGGCELWQVVDYYTPYILFPYSPSKIFIYAGENDIAGGKSGKFVFDEFQKLWNMIHQKLPEANIFFMSIKESPSRAKYFPEVLIANALIKNYLAKKPHSTYIDVNTVLFQPGSSEPDPLLFGTDMLHLNSKGYDRWQKVLEPYLN